MVKHIVMYTLKDGIEKQSEIKRIASLLEPLAGQIPGLKTLEVRPSYQGGMDYALYSEFESKEALNVYAQHPLHLAAKKQFCNSINSRVSADYEV